MENLNGYYEGGQPKKPVYNNAHRRMLLGALAIAVTAVYLLYGEYAPQWQVIGAVYAAFWGVYTIVCYLTLWDKLRRNREAWLIIGVAAVLLIRYQIYASEPLLIMNLLIVPLVLMLHAVVGAAPVESGSESGYVIYYLRGWFVYPFKCIPRFFGACGSLFKAEGARGKRGRRALAGAAIAVPLLAVVLFLLASADAVIGLYMNRIFERLSLPAILKYAVTALTAAMLFYSFLFSLRELPFKPRKAEREPARFDPVPLGAAIGILLAVYALFTVLQFAYLTGWAGLPDGLTYSQYAVSGFRQLLAVAAINLALFAVALSRAKGARWLKGLLLGLLAATGVIIYSGIYRLSMYISAYGLTFSRLLSMWLMIFMAAALVLCAVRLFLPRLKLVRLLAALFLIWYAALNLVNVDAVIAQSVIERSIIKGGLSERDINYIEGLSSDADGVRARCAELLDGRSP